MTTKVTRNMLDTSIVDNGNATALTIDTNENIGIASRISVGTTTVGSGNTRAVITGGNDNYLQMVSNAGNGGISIGNHAGGIMLFYSHTGALGSESFTQNLRLDTDGLKFGTDSAAANALDDYEEGTWTPATNGTGVGITTYTATYTKIGDLVMYRCYIQIGVNSAGDAAKISGLPFTNGGSNFWCAGSIWENNAKQPYVLVSDGGNDTIQLRQNSNGSSHPYSDFSNTQIIITGTYKTLQ